MLTPSVAKMLAEGRSAGLEAVFAWQYSAQIRDEVIRSGVRSLLQSISIFRMREMEDARSLAGLAMEVYSDRISIDQDEQERLRFSPDDIIRLPIHRAINLWVAHGGPRAGFLAHTLPMEQLHDADLAGHHRDAQRERGGHHPASLPDPLADDPSALIPSPAGARDARNGQRRASSRAAATQNGTAPSRSEHRDAEALQLPLAEAMSGTPERARGLATRAARELHRRAPLRRRRHRARPPRPARAVRGPAARRRGHPRRLALQVPHRTAAARAVVAAALHPGRPTAACCKLFRAGYLERFRPHRAPRLVPWTYHLGARRPPPAPARRHHRDRASASPPARDLRLRPRPARAPAQRLGARLPPRPRRRAARLGRRDRHRTAAPRPDRRNCASTTTGQPKASATRAPACCAPTPCSRSNATTTRPARRTVPRRVRPHPPRRQELRQVPPLRRLPLLVVAPHAPRRPRRSRPSSSSSAKTKTSASQFLAAADRELTGHRWHPSVATRPPRVRRPPTHPLRARARRPRRRARGLATARLPARPPRAHC